MDQERKYRAPALQKGLSILETLAHTDQAMSMSDISTALGRSRNEIFRMLQVLEEMHYIARDATGGYTLTNRLFALGMQRPPVRDLIATALPVMHDLAEETQQSCHLAVMSGSEMVVVVRTEAPGLLGFAVRVGHRQPLPLAASGLTMMAFQPETTLDKTIEQIEAAHGPIDRDALIATLDRIREQGYVSQDSATITAIHDISAPILVEMSAVAALTVPFVSGIGTRIGIARTTRLLRTAAAAISRALQPARIE